MYLPVLDVAELEAPRHDVLTVAANQTVSHEQLKCIHGIHVFNSSDSSYMLQSSMVNIETHIFLNLLIFKVLLFYAIYTLPNLDSAKKI